MNFDRIISADSHIMEPLDLWTSVLGDRFGNQTPRGLNEFAGKEGTFFFSGREVLTMGDPEAEAGAGLAESKRALLAGARGRVGRRSRRRLVE